MTIHQGPMERSLSALSTLRTAGTSLRSFAPAGRCLPFSSPGLCPLSPATGSTHLKLGSWAEATSEPRSDVPMVRSYPS